MKQNIFYKDSQNKGFSMVELIVIVAIMIVLLAILTPSLLRYTENSRTQKDDSAMDELCGTIKLALADADIFDEACAYAIRNNYVTYTDSSGVYGAKYTDEEFWAPDGSGYAVTITFNPDENGTYTLSEGLVNDMTYGNGSVADSRVGENLQQCYFSEMGDAKLYHKVEQTFGTTFSEKSATYNNSSYTVFITFDVVDGIKRADVYGEWNGTNLSPDCPASLGSGTSSYTEEEEPEQTKSGGTTQSNFTSSDLQGSGGTSDETPNYKNILPCGHKNTDSGDHTQKKCGHWACKGCTCPPTGLDTLTPVTFNELNNFLGRHVWNDNGKTYYSQYEEKQYILNGTTWEPIDWGPYTNGFAGVYVWYNEILGRTYLCQNCLTRTFIDGKWTGRYWYEGNRSFSHDTWAEYIWTDGEQYYYSNGDKHWKMIMNPTGTSHTMSEVRYKWDREPSGASYNKKFTGNYVWSDGSNTYYSKGANNQWILREDTWEKITWNGYDGIIGCYVWTDGDNFYYSYGTAQYVLKGDAWEPKVWTGLSSFNANDVWTDGTYYYYSNGDTQYKFS